jgi:hypothetical protein
MPGKPNLMMTRTGLSCPRRTSGSTRGGYGRCPWSNAAQVKLGRRDARLLIDAVTVSLTHARSYLSAELANRVDGLLGQLRFAQVAAEGRAGQPGQVKEENDLDRVPTPPAATQAGPPTEQAPRSTQTSGLWVPGR